MKHRRPFLQTFGSSLQPEERRSRGGEVSKRKRIGKNWRTGVGGEATEREVFAIGGRPIAEGEKRPCMPKEGGQIAGHVVYTAGIRERGVREGPEERGSHLDSSMSSAWSAAGVPIKAERKKAGVSEQLMENHAKGGGGGVTSFRRGEGRVGGGR